MEIIKIFGIGILTSFAFLVLKQIKVEFAVLVGFCGSIIIVLMVIDSLSWVVDYFYEIINRTGINNELFLSILKIIGIAYLTEFASSICKDCGAVSVSEKIIVAGKTIILCLSFPIITSLIDTIILIMNY